MKLVEKSQLEPRYASLIIGSAYWRRHGASRPWLSPARAVVALVVGGHGAVPASGWYRGTWTSRQTAQPESPAGQESRNALWA
jgi:hypothetical protein